MIGIVYSQATGRIRSIIYPDHDADLHSVKLGTGEAMETMDLPQDQVPNVHALQALLNDITNLIPANDLYAVVDANGNVTGAIIADPTCGDTVPNHQLIAHEQAHTLIGGTYLNSIFAAKTEALVGMPKVDSVGIGL